MDIGRTIGKKPSWDCFRLLQEHDVFPTNAEYPRFLPQAMNSIHHSAERIERIA